MSQGCALFILRSKVKVKLGLCCRGGGGGICPFRTALVSCGVGHDFILCLQFVVYPTKYSRAKEPDAAAEILLR